MPARHVFLAGTAAALAPLTLKMLRLEQAMHHAGGAGIVALELAGTSQRLRRLVHDWGDPGVEAARQSLRLDYAYMTGYGFAATLLVATAADRGPAAAATPLPPALVAWGIVGAVLCDAVEGTTLLYALRDSAGNWPAPLATSAALLKFALLATGLAYCFQILRHGR